MTKTLDTTLYKARIFYEHGKLRKENMNRNRDKSKDFFDNCKPFFNPPPYRKQNNRFLVNKNFNKSGTKPYVLAPNVNKPVKARGANATPLQIKWWKFTGPHYARDCKNKINGGLHNLQVEPRVEDIAGTLRIYAIFDG